METTNAQLATIAQRVISSPVLALLAPIVALLEELKSQTVQLVPQENTVPTLQRLQKATIVKVVTTARKKTLISSNIHAQLALSAPWVSRLNVNQVIISQMRFSPTVRHVQLVTIAQARK